MIKDQRTVFRVVHNLVENKHKIDVFKPFYKVLQKDLQFVLIV